MSVVFWDVKRCGCCKSRRFGGTYLLSHQAETNQRDRKNLFLCSVLQLLVTANVVPSSLLLSTLMMQNIRSPKRRFLQEPHVVTSQKTAFFELRYVCRIYIACAVSTRRLHQLHEKKNNVASLCLLVSSPKLFSRFRLRCVKAVSAKSCIANYFDACLFPRLCPQTELDRF
jgi:hypothetical protein